MPTNPTHKDDVSPERCLNCREPGALRCSSDGEAEWVVCTKCGREGPVSLNRTEAITMWNEGYSRESARTQPAGLVEALRLAERALATARQEVTSGHIKHQIIAAEHAVIAALTSSDSPVVGEDAPHWRWGYTDGVPGTPGYESAPQVCIWCNTVRSRCQCDSKPASTDTADAFREDNGDKDRENPVEAPTDTADRREAIARVIDPWAMQTLNDWRERGKAAARDVDIDPENEHVEKLARDNRDSMAERRQNAYAKADAIASLIAGPPENR